MSVAVRPSLCPMCMCPAFSEYRYAGDVAAVRYQCVMCGWKLEGKPILPPSVNATPLTSFAPHEAGAQPMLRYRNQEFGSVERVEL